MGLQTGRVLSWAKRSKTCLKCKRGAHDCEDECVKNFEGSSKAMEASMAVELINHNDLLKDQNVVVSVLVGDDDSSAVAAVRVENPNLIKWSDFNHAAKSFRNALYAIKLSPKLIKYFSKCFGYAVKENKGEADKVRAALLNIVPHAFGVHSGCGEWCHKDNIDNKHHHKNLPHGKPLCDSNLRINLTSAVTRFANNSEKIAPCASSQANEAFNGMVARKSPKSKFFSGTKSFGYRLAAAVAQKNIGHFYLNNVFNELGLLSGKWFLKYRYAKDHRIKLQAEYKRKVTTKRQRLIAKAAKTRKDNQKKRKEGISYQSASGLSTVSHLLQFQAKVQDTSDSVFIFFDLETTGFGDSKEICQVCKVLIER